MEEAAAEVEMESDGMADSFLQEGEESALKAFIKDYKARRQVFHKRVAIAKRYRQVAAGV